MFGCWKPKVWTRFGSPSWKRAKSARTRPFAKLPREMGCGCLEIRLAAGGRANLFATEDCCLLVDDELLKQINCISSIVIATGLISALPRRASASPR